MKVGDLFINIGLNGADKVVGGLGKAEKSLSNVKTMSLEAKAGILAMLYGFQQLTSASNTMGTSLTNFNALTGISIDTLQRWQYAGRQVGATNEGIESSFKGINAAMAAMSAGTGAPAYLRTVQGAVGFSASRAVTDTTYAMEQLQKYALSESDPGRRNLVLRSFGLGDDMITAMARNAFRPEIFAKAPTLSKGEVGSLDKNRKIWGNVATQSEMAFAHFNARHGAEIASGVSKIIPHVVKLAEAFERLAVNIHIFDLIGKAFEGWAQIFDTLTALVTSFTETIDGISKDKDGVIMGTVHAAGRGLKDGSHFAGQAANSVFIDPILYGDGKPVGPMVLQGLKHPALTKEQAKYAAHIIQNITHHGDASDTHGVKKLHGDSVKHAYRQLPAGEAK